MLCLIVLCMLCLIVVCNDSNKPFASGNSTTVMGNDLPTHGQTNTDLNVWLRAEGCCYGDSPCNMQIGPRSGFIMYLKPPAHEECL